VITEAGDEKGERYSAVLVHHVVVCVCNGVNHLKQRQVMRTERHGGVDVDASREANN
jgi:hypothetical protein